MVRVGFRVRTALLLTGADAYSYPALVEVPFIGELPFPETFHYLQLKVPRRHRLGSYNSG